MTDYKTEKNLQGAFAGESQANRRYLFFADKADKEGQPQVARLFRAAAEAETVHARNHLNAMDAIGSTKENVMAASVGENYEFTKMYPPFIEQAIQEKNKKAQRSFELANEVEEIHHKYFEAALKVLNAGTKLKEEPYYVCQVCGNTITGAVPDVCPICGTAHQFKKVE
ncbi:MAG: rubrerythrin family protein [Chloroflexota bacterium]